MQLSVRNPKDWIKWCVPYGIFAWHLERKYGEHVAIEKVGERGWFARLRRAFKRILPFGLVYGHEEFFFGRHPKDLEALAESLGYFNRAWYLSQNPDVAAAGVDARRHFFREGWREGRDPSPYFSVRGYLTAYPDVMASGMNPLSHYLLRGRFEGRNAWAEGPFLGGEPSWRDRRAAARRKADPTFTVIVASYNYEDLVIEALESILAQTYRHFDVVVIDDQSEDRSVENIRAFIARHANSGVEIKFLTHDANMGLAETVRQGVECATGEYVAFCEADDLWTPDHLEVLSEFIKRYASADVIANDVEIFGDPARVARFQLHRAERCARLRQTCNRISAGEFRRANYLLTFSATAVRRTAFAGCDYRPLVRPSALDWWLWRQICFRRPVYFVNTRLTRWRMHDSYMFKDTAARSASVQQEVLERFALAADEMMAKRFPFSPRVWLMRLANRRPRSGYALSMLRRIRFEAEREKGLREYAHEIADSSARILVCLHLFYEDAWPTVELYLRNLSPYKCSFLITYTEGRVPEALKERVRRFADAVTLLEVPNLGFDVGPFVESLRSVDLSKYDIVFKLQTKGVRRPSIFIYDQVFKKSDWFFNLFEGVLGGRNVHRTISLLASRQASLVAAENLIVADPVHKQSFVRRFCAERGLDYVEGYRYVAGTCFAARAEVFAPLKALGLRIDDFASAKPGEFSLAHALERWMCFAANGALVGNETRHAVYPAEAARLYRESALRLLEDDRFKIDYDFFYRVLEMRRIRRYEVVRVALGSIRRAWVDGRLYPLSECAPYKYLNGDADAYAEYCSTNRLYTGFEMSAQRFDSLCRDMETYDPKSMPVVRGKRNIIIDGQHRSCILLNKFGPDHLIDVLRIE